MQKIDLKVRKGKQLVEYIQDCYKMSRFCDLIIVASGRKSVHCHKMILCSLSRRLHSICSAEEDDGDITYIHLPEFTYMEVRDFVDKIYESIGRSEVEMERNEVITTLGIECTPLKPGLATPSVKVEEKYSDEEPEETSIADDFPHSDVDETFEASSVKNEADGDLGEDAFQERRHSGRRRKVIKSHYKEDSDFEMDDDEDGDADIANSSSDEDTKPEKPKRRKRSDHALNSSDSIVQFNDYSGSRKDFWNENFVKTTLKVSMLA